MWVHLGVWQLLRKLRWVHVTKGVALILLLEQGAEAAFFGHSLAENPVLAAAALGALAAPVPEPKEPR